jgi:hypothetical protein
MGLDDSGHPGVVVGMCRSGCLLCSLRFGVLSGFGILGLSLGAYDQNDKLSKLAVQKFGTVSLYS